MGTAASGQSRTKSTPREANGSNPREDCPNCGLLHGLVDFYEVPDIPVHSVLLMNDYDDAVSYRKRDLLLSYCRGCGFILNRVFDPHVHEYSSRYEETQGFSETFNSFSDRLAQQLIERHSLFGKKIIEIGCGKGEFLTRICELGGNTGLGFDPAYVPDRSRARPLENVSFIKDFYSETYASHRADFFCCKMTLEHINETRQLMLMIRAALNDSPDTVVFFQVPDVTRVLEEAAFWDIYYEHCSYFSDESLAFLFRSTGFDVLDLWHDYDGQYLMIEARPTAEVSTALDSVESLPQEIINQITQFTDSVKRLRASWKAYLQSMRSGHRPVALWGGGSKAVAFLTTLDVADEVACAVDINPNKHGTYLPGTGHRVVAPEELTQLKPETIIAMNPVYMDEIQIDLDRLGLNAELLPITWSPSLELDTVKGTR